MGQMELQADSIRLLLRNVPGLIGAQPQKIHIEVENSKLGHTRSGSWQRHLDVAEANAMNASGRIETSNDNNIYLRITGLFLRLKIRLAILRFSRRPYFSR